MKPVKPWQPNKYSEWERIWRYDDAPKPTKKELHDEYILSDANMADIAEARNVTVHIVKRWLKDYGIRKRSTQSETWKRAVYVLIQNGFSGDQVAELLDTTKPTAFKISSNYGKSLKNSGGDK